MAEERDIYTEPASRQNGSTSDQHQPPQSFDTFSFQDNVFEDAEFWPLHEAFFDVSGITPAPPISDMLPPLRSPVAIDQGYESLENPASHVQDMASPSDPESVAPNDYGFGDWLSVCSGPAVDWMREKTRSNQFDEIAVGLKAIWAQQTKFDRAPPTSRCEEPKPHLAWTYCNAYFERSVGNLWEMVYRPNFERHLRAHLSGQIHYHDPTWYALRNVIYAAGCRIYRSEFSAVNSLDIQRECWGYFANALSVHSELLLTKPTLRSVRALLIMTLLAESLSATALSSGLVSNAAFHAQSLGLHRHGGGVDMHDDSESLQQRWLFWAVYCAEKHIAQRLCQPSVINDDDITCKIPTTVYPGSKIDIEMFTYTIETCRLYDQVNKQLIAIRALHEPPAKMLSFVGRFDKQLRTWKESMPSQLRPSEFLRQFTMPGTMRLLGLMSVHSSFYDLVMVTHSIFMYPWVVSSFSSDGDPNFARKLKAQTMTSSHLVANAARSLIVMTRSLDMDSIGIQRFTLHLPLRAFMNLFIYVIDNPRLPTVQSDLALLDVAAGYFGQMEFVTGSKFSFPFARDIAALARNVADDARTVAPEIPIQVPHDMEIDDYAVANATELLHLQATNFDSWIV